MERMLEWAVADNREASAATLPQHTENAVRLLHMVQDFLQAEGLVSPALWTEKVLEETVTLMDSLMVWYSAGDQWFQLSQVGLRLLLGFMAQEDPEVSVIFLGQKQAPACTTINTFPASGVRNGHRQAQRHPADKGGVQSGRGLLPAG